MDQCSLTLHFSHSVWVNSTPLSSGLSPCAWWEVLELTASCLEPKAQAGVGRSRVLCGCHAALGSTHLPAPTGQALGGGRWAAIQVARGSDSAFVISSHVTLMCSLGPLRLPPTSLHTIVLVLEMGVKRDKNHQTVSLQ